MSIDFIRPEVDELRPRISVIGVGGAGGNAIANMLRADVQGVSDLSRRVSRHERVAPRRAGHT
jgi:cell division protein FtsZ